MKNSAYKRILSALLTVILLVGASPVAGFAEEGEESSSSVQNTAPQVSVQEEPKADLPVDESTLIITADGAEPDHLEMYSYQKVEITAAGLDQEADYQWQILHPEQDDLWVNIYDATASTLPVTAALVNNMLNEDGVAVLRCRAYTKESAYLSAPLSVSFREESAVPVDSTDSAIPADSANSVNSLDLAEGDIPEFVSITIEYILYTYVQQGDDFAEMEIGEAFTPYEATLKSETSLQDRDVPCPIVVGYNPELVKVTEGGTERDPIADEFYIRDDGTACVKINQTNITADVTYRVEYHPAQVNYEVRYFFQNIYDDLYVENSSILAEAGIHTYPVIAQGYTGTHPNKTYTEAKFAGFTSLYYEPETIAADGSTVFNVYYERNYCLMEFDCAGGYGTDTIYVRYGTYISVPDPVRSGWNFAGWDLTGAEDSDGTPLTLKDSNGNDIPYSDGVKNDLPANMPRYNSSYKALWTRSATTFTVIYWVQNANDDGYSYVDSIEDVAATTGDKINLSTITSYINPSDSSAISTTCPDDDLASYVTLNTTITTEVTVEGDGSTNFSIYFDRNEYTFKFYYARSYVSNNTTYYQFSSNTGDFNNDPSSLIDSWLWHSATQTKPVLSSVYTEMQETKASYTYYYFTETFRFGQNVATTWPSAPIDNAKTKETTAYNNICFVSWGPDKDSTYYANHSNNRNIKGPYSVIDAQLIIDPTAVAPAINHAFCAYYGSPNMYTYKVYFEALSGQSTDYTDTSTGKNYTLYATYTVGSTASASDQTPLELVGVTHAKSIHDSAITGDNTEKTVMFLYSRNSSALKFDNYGVTHKEVIVSYGQSIAPLVEAAGTPDYPTTLEPGAYYFAGWYTGPNGTGEKITAETTMSMPDAGLSLFAYWKPVTHNVYFYYNYSDYVAALDPENTEDKYWYHEENGVKVPDKYPIEVVHGSLVGTTYSNIPEAEEDYSFVGWFYIDETGKKKFAPDSMEVKKDLHLFAEWQSGIDTQYQVTYVLENNYGSYPAGTPVAKPTAGHLTAGKTKTFNAKVGTELLSDFKDLPLFPTVNSHSILMEEDSENNTFEFTYVHDDEVYYIVRYIDKITGLPLQAAKIEKSTKAIVTEKFVQFDGYLPDNYYIRKVLAADGDVGAGGDEVTEDDVNELNEIIFYYTPDHEHGLYVIEYYTQVLGGSGNFNDDTSWYLEQSELGTANLNDTISVTVNPTKFSGFSYSQSQITSYDENGNKTVKSTPGKELSGTVTEHGLEIRIYYTRNSYPYTVQYVEYGTGNVLYTDTKTGTEAKPYQDTVTVTAPAEYQPGEIKYLFYSTAEKPQTQAMDIRATDTGNVMTFYYRARTVSIYYKAVCLTAGATDYGGVSLNYESAATATNISGSEALPGEGFKFVGWYSDEACTDTALVGNNPEYKPTTLPDKDSVTYYALFEPVLTEMTISKTVTTTNSSTDTSCNHTFLFLIEGQNKHSYLTLTVAVTVSGGTGSVTITNLPIDTYKVTELSDWSWQHECTSGAVTIELTENPATNSAAFTNVHANPDWLGGESKVVINNFD